MSTKDMRKTTMSVSEHGAKANSYQQNRNEPGIGLLEPVPSLVMDGFDEPPAFPAAGWLDGGSPSLVDHPLLRGLLLELPPKGTKPSPEWMNRWFEAARAVLDLIYNGAD